MTYPVLTSLYLLTLAHLTMRVRHWILMLVLTLLRRCLLLAEGWGCIRLWTTP
jgi:hypothetical protein